MPTDKHCRRCFGPISVMFDYATSGLLWFGLGTTSAPALFQTGWFVESLLSQTLIVYVIRTSTLPTPANRPSTALLAASLLVYAALTQVAKAWLTRRFGIG